MIYFKTIKYYANVITPTPAKVFKISFQFTLLKIYFKSIISNVEFKNLLIILNYNQF